MTTEANGASQNASINSDIKLLFVALETMDSKPDLNVIAEKLGISKGAAQKRFSRLTQRLRSSYETAPVNDKDKPSDDGNGETINGDLNEKQIKSPRKKQKAETTNKGGKADHNNSDSGEATPTTKKRSRGELDAAKNGTKKQRTSKEAVKKEETSSQVDELAV